MRLSAVFSLGALVACAIASPIATTYVVHEKRHVNSDDLWDKGAELDPSRLIPLRIGLKQSNLDRGHDWLMEVSDPTSKKYGQHWTAEQVADAFKPSAETVKVVHDWLHGAGIDSKRHRLSEGLNWLEVEVTAAEAEDILRAKYHLFEHKTTATKHVACDSYSLPSHVQDHIDFISPGVHFDAKVRGNKDQFYDASGNVLEKRSWGPWQRKAPGPMPHLPMPFVSKVPETADICNYTYVTPYCLRVLYDVPSNLPAVDGNTIGIVEYTPESYFPSDLTKFFQYFEPRAAGEQPVFDSIDGGFLYNDFNESEAFDYLGEPSLDLQYSMALLYPQNVILYQVGDLQEADNTSFNNFLDAIDASYCKYDGGDEAPYDAVYPDPYSGPNSYKGKENCGTYTAAKVISTSYSYDEFSLPLNYEVRQCQEYMKLGLMGTTFAYSSGDYGVAGYSGYCLNEDGTLNDGTFGLFVPTFPSGCPYVLSVGATQIKNGTKDVEAAVAAGEEVEVAMELYLVDGYVGDDFPIGGDPIGSSIFSSSGGFSNVFAMPSYQQTAVQDYINSYAPSYPGQYNNSGTSRGYPDISSNGAWFNIVVDGELSNVFGTSCAAPTVAALLGLINGRRIAAGKSSVGFINPTLYAHPEVLNDITLGGNPGCGTYGFNAEPGWDPVTGLGTPNFPKMLELFLSLD